MAGESEARAALLDRARKMAENCRIAGHDGSLAVIEDLVAEIKRLSTPDMFWGEDMDECGALSDLKDLAGYYWDCLDEDCQGAGKFSFSAASARSLPTIHAVATLAGRDARGLPTFTVETYPTLTEAMAASGEAEAG